jgi:arylsulfatase
MMALLWLQQACALQAGSNPNILLIMADDMGYSDLGCYGGEIRTSNLDRLAANGMRFSQFYNGARCCPTRASLLTGLYAHQTGVGHMLQNQGLPGYQTGLNQNCLTLAEALRINGYATYMSGKWHVTTHTLPDGPKHTWPLQRGFDQFYGTIIGAGSFYDPNTLCRQNTFITPENDSEYKPETYYYTDAITDNAISFLEKHHRSLTDKPFFLYLSYTAAHWPMHALPEDIEAYKGVYRRGYSFTRHRRYERLIQLGLIPSDTILSPGAGDWEQVENKPWEERCMEVYAAMVDRMDQGIGRIVAYLKAQDALDNTLICYLQDNGGCAEGMGRGRDINDRWVGAIPDTKQMGADELQPKLWPPMKTREGLPVRGGPEVMPGPADTYIAYGQHWANVSNTPFREYKHWVHEGGIATPLIMHWPNQIKQPGSITHEPGHIIDIMATFMDAAGATYPLNEGGNAIQPMQGTSLLPVIKGQRLKDRKLFWEHEANCAVRVGDWKLVRKNNLSHASNSDWELYNLKEDRSEMRNVAHKFPKRAESLAKEWQKWAEDAQVIPWPWKQNPLN